MAYFAYYCDVDSYSPFDSFSSTYGSPKSSVASSVSAKDSIAHGSQAAEKCSQSTFRNVAELSLGSERFSGLATVDMVIFFLGNFSSLKI